MAEPKQKIEEKKEGGRTGGGKGGGGAAAEPWRGWEIQNLPFLSS